MKIMVTGGAGYVGSRLIPTLLLRGYNVKCFDIGEHGTAHMAMNFEYGNFEMTVEDIRNFGEVDCAMADCDVIIHLAALVGYPACNADPQSAISINQTASIMINKLRSRDQRVIFASTGSVYGVMDDVACTEDTPANPTSLYARTKLKAEEAFLDRGNAVVLRFGTGFGLSYKMRTDTLVNDFTRQAVQNERLMLYQQHAMRSIIHVNDMARALIHAIEIPDGIYNCASMNLTKRDIADEIAKAGINYRLVINDDSGSDPEFRDYQTKCEKLEATGFSMKNATPISKAIKEMARYYDTAC